MELNKWGTFWRHRDDGTYRKPCGIFSVVATEANKAEINTTPGKDQEKIK